MSFLSAPWKNVIPNFLITFSNVGLLIVKLILIFLNLILKQSANKTSYSTQQLKLCTLVKTLSMLEFHSSTLQ